MNKRLISLVLTFIMLITMVPSTIIEASEVTTMESVKASSNQSEVTKPEENTIYAVNPLYEDVISIDDLKKRLSGRGTEKQETIDKRIDVAQKEIESGKVYKYHIVNDDLDKSIEKVVGVIKKEMDM